MIWTLFNFTICAIIKRVEYELGKGHLALSDVGVIADQKSGEEQDWFKRIISFSLCKAMVPHLSAKHQKSCADIFMTMLGK